MLWSKQALTASDSSHRSHTRPAAVLLALALAVAAGACGDDSPDEAAAAAPASTTASEPASTMAAEPTSTTASDGASTPSTDGSPAPTAEPATRTVVHAVGETAVPANPRRVVVLDAGTTLPTLLDLDVPVVAAPLPADDYSTELLAEGALDGIESIGFPEPSPEAILSAEPDLIVGLDIPELRDIHDVLSQIAPTVLVDSTLSQWKVQARELADAVGRADGFDDQLAAYESDVASLANELGDPSAIEVSVIRSLGDQFRIHTRFHFAGQIIEEVGLSRPASQHTDDPDERLIQLSLEELPRADADVIYLYARGAVGGDSDGIDENLADLRSIGLWNNLRAVEEGAVHVVDPLAWQQGGLPAAELILADVRRTLIG